MRWADMDLLGHVNNVTYLDYVAEARENLFAGHPAATAAVARHQVEFVKPLVFRRQPVLVDTWVTDIADDEVTLAHEVYDDAGGRRVASGPSTCARPPCWRTGSPTPSVPWPSRRADLPPTGDR